MSRGGRIACLLVPDLVLHAELRAHPEAKGQPLVVASGEDARAEVIAVSPEALRMGVRAQRSVAQCRAACAELLVRPVSPALERAARDCLLDVALSCAPRAELAPRREGFFAAEAAAFVDAAGVATLFHSEAGFATALGARAAALGLPAAVAVSGTRNVSHLAAREAARREGPGGVHVLPAGEELRFLEPLPIDLLEPDDALAQKLTRFGVRRIRDLLKLPRRALAQRLGAESLRLAARARGEEADLPLSEPGSAQLREAVDLDYEIAQLEPLLFALRGLLSRLMQRLQVRALACRELELNLELQDGARDVRRVAVAAPTRDVRVLLRVLGLALESRPPAAPVRGAALAAEGEPGRFDQLDLFRPRGPDPGELDRALAELESLCGAGRVGAPAVADDHRPDAYALEPFRPGHGEPGRAGEAVRDAAPGGALVVRALRPAVAAQVEVQGGRPVALRSAVASGRIVHVSGPWRTTGGWWSEQDRYALDHFDAQVSDGTVLRLCFDWMDRSWRIDALYD